MPQRPEPPSEKPRSSLLPITLAVLLLVIICAALFFPTLGSFGIVLVIGCVVFGIAAMHYLLWGWWLGKMIRDDVEAEEREKK
jgi:protein-S-isoprenylcysteine O-methyltransferase Ste14